MSSPAPDASARPIETAQAAPPAAGNSPLIIANMPEHCARAEFRVDLDAAGRYVLPQVSSIGALRKMVQGDNLMLSARGMGALVLDDFVAAAFASHPPFIVLADGTVITARQALALPDGQIDPGGCQGRQSLDQWAENLAQIVTAAGPLDGQQPVASEFRMRFAGLESASQNSSAGAGFRSELAISVFDVAAANPIVLSPVASPVPDSVGPPVQTINLFNDFPVGGRLVRGGGGDDTLIFSSIADSYDGGGGFDTLRFADNVVGALDLTAARRLDKQIENIDRLSLEGGNPVTLSLDVQGILDLEPDGNTLLVSGSPGDVIDLAEPVGVPTDGGWVKVAETTTADTWTYASAAGGAPLATLVVDSSVNVI